MVGNDLMYGPLALSSSAYLHEFQQNTSQYLDYEWLQMPSPFYYLVHHQQFRRPSN